MVGRVFLTEHFHQAPLGHRREMAHPLGITVVVMKGQVQLPVKEMLKVVN